MKISYKILATSVAVFVTTALFAQEKRKTLELNEEGREVIERKEKRVDSTARKAHLYLKEYRVDSTHESQLRFRKQRVDSSRHMNAIRITKRVSDSTRHFKAISIRKHRRDSSDRSRPAKDIRSKKVMVSLSCKPDATVFLQNIMHKVTILTTDDDKVMLVTTVLHQGQSSLTDSEWLSKLKLNLSGDENEVEVKSEDLSINAAHDGTTLDSIFNGVPVFDSLGNIIGARSQSERNLLLYLPKGAKVDIESKYADITFENNVGKLKAKITSGVLTLMDADQLFSNSSYAHIFAGRIRLAEVEITNGKFSAKNVDTLQISSSNSSVGVDRVDILYIKSSQADQYTIQEAKHISGKKAFGSLQLSTLAGSVDLMGKNSNVKIRRINASASAVKITTQYASLRLPTNNLKNYTVAFQGSGGSIRTPFEKSEVTSASFKASIGSMHKKPTLFQLNCRDCTVNFN